MSECISECMSVYMCMSKCCCAITLAVTSVDKTTRTGCRLMGSFRLTT